MSEVNPRKRLAVDTVVLDSMLMEYITSEDLVDSSASNSTPQVADMVQSHHYAERILFLCLLSYENPVPPPSPSIIRLLDTETPACSQKMLKAQQEVMSYSFRLHVC